MKYENAEYHADEEIKAEEECCDKGKENEGGYTYTNGIARKRNKRV